MEADELREYLLSQKGTSEETPFGPDVLVYKVAGKMFATIGFDEKDGFGRVNLKCDPNRAIELRESYEAIIPGYHMNKTHWNTLILNRTLEQSLVEELVGHSYALVVAKLSKKVRQEFNL